MGLPLPMVVEDFAIALKAVDDTHPQGMSRKYTYRPV